MLPIDPLGAFKGYLLGNHLEVPRLAPITDQTFWVVPLSNAFPRCTCFLVNPQNSIFNYTFMEKSTFSSCPSKRYQTSQIFDIEGAMILHITRKLICHKLPTFEFDCLQIFIGGLQHSGFHQHNADQ